MDLFVDLKEIKKTEYRLSSNSKKRKIYMKDMSLFALFWLLALIQENSKKNSPPPPPKKK